MHNILITYTVLEELIEKLIDYKKTLEIIEDSLLELKELLCAQESDAIKMLTEYSKKSYFSCYD